MVNCQDRTDITTGLEVYRPDLVLWDMGWDPALTGTQHASAAGQEETKSPLERLTDLCDTGHPVVILLPDATHAAAARMAGASGLLLRQAQAEQLTTSLRAVVQGLIVIDSAFAHALLPHPYSRTCSACRYPHTTRARRVAITGGRLAQQDHC